MSPEDAKLSWKDEEEPAKTIYKSVIKYYP
jgi:hypothetical protein